VESGGAAALPPACSGLEDRCGYRIPHQSRHYRVLDDSVKAGAMGDWIRIAVWALASGLRGRRYRPPQPRQPSQHGRAFLESHVGDPVAMDFFVIPTVTFRVLYVPVMMAHD
jgi:hypothetical protein